MDKSKILIADDEPLNIELYAQMLKQSGIKILKAGDGSEALRIIQSERPDVVLLDWNMPVMNGLEVLRHIKAEKETSDIPVIMITGVMTASDNLQMALQAGAVDLIRKPFDRTELTARVRSVLLLASSMRELREKYQIIENSNKFIQSLIESVPHPLVWYSPDGIIQGCNQLFEAHAGLRFADLSGKLVYRYLDWENTSGHIRLDQSVMNRGASDSIETQGSGSEKSFIFSKSAYHDSSGQARGLLCIILDVTEMKKLHENIVESKKRELVSSALRLIQANELNNQLVEELGKLNAFTNREGSGIIRSIIHNYSMNSGESIWKDFELRFEQVYEGFYKKLNDLVPGLTAGERKLCAMLRLDISSKDIAALTFQNPSSVDMARYRLRKKLNLPSDQNLIDFLMKIE